MTSTSLPMVSALFDASRWGAPAWVLFGLPASSRSEAERVVDAALAQAGAERTAWREEGAGGVACEVPVLHRRLQWEVGADGSIACDGQPVSGPCFAQVAERLWTRIRAIEREPDVEGALRFTLAHRREGMVRATAHRWFPAADIAEASAVCRAFVAAHSLTGYEWSGGEVRTFVRGAGGEVRPKLIGVIERNGALWSACGTRKLWTPAEGVMAPRSSAASALTAA